MNYHAPNRSSGPGLKRMLFQMDKQSKEFDAVERLAKEMRRISMTAVVDDDYPEVRFDYESALADLIDAMENNGRFAEGNRYGLKTA